MTYQMPNPAIEGWMGPDELDWLYQRAQEMESIVEIGSWKGRSAHALCSGCPGMVYTVEHFKGNPNELQGAHREATERDISIDFANNMKGFQNLKLLRMDSVEAAKQFQPASIDMVFIDGCHVYEHVMADLKAWRPICKKLLCGHDYSSVDRALRDFGIATCERPVGQIWSYKV